MGCPLRQKQTQVSHLANAPLQGALKSQLLGLKVLVELAGPVPDHADVKADDVTLLGGRRDGEGMPLEGGDRGNVDEDVIARLEGKVRRPPNHLVKRN